MSITGIDMTARIESALAHAVELAARGPMAGGNPRVGCVLLGGDGLPLGEGFHRGAGSPHAEADALASVPPSRRSELTGATAVITLEPCRHVGRTPPCVVALREAGLARVVYAVRDPDEAAGGGAAWLNEAGVETVTARQAGVAPAVVERAEELTHAWRTAVGRRRPWLIAKTAASWDGRVAAADGTSRWITGEAARQHAHTVRAQVDAIAVGTGTVLADDPALTVRSGGEAACRQPLRVVLGEREVPPGARLRRGPGAWRRMPTRDLTAALEELYAAGMRSVLLEGGPTLLAAALRAGVVDEVHAYLAPLLLGAGTSAVADLGVTTLSSGHRLHPVSTEVLGADVFIAARPLGETGRAVPAASLFPSEGA